MNRLDQRRLAHAAGAPQQDIVCRKALGEAQCIVMQDIADVIHAPDQGQSDAVGFCYRLQMASRRRPDETVCRIPIVFRRTWSGESLDRVGQAAQLREDEMVEFLGHDAPFKRTSRLIRTCFFRAVAWPFRVRKGNRREFGTSGRCFCCNREARHYIPAT